MTPKNRIALNSFLFSFLKGSKGKRGRGEGGNGGEGGKGGMGEGGMGEVYFSLKFP